MRHPCITHYERNYMHNARMWFSEKLDEYDQNTEFTIYLFSSYQLCERGWILRSHSAHPQSHQHRPTTYRPLRTTVSLCIQFLPFTCTAPLTCDLSSSFLSLCRSGVSMAQFFGACGSQNQICGFDSCIGG